MGRLRKPEVLEAGLAFKRRELPFSAPVNNSERKYVSRLSGVMGTLLRPFPG